MLHSGHNYNFFNMTVSESDFRLKDNFSKNSQFTIQVDRNLLIITSYENALRTAQNFLSMFLNK